MLKSRRDEYIARYETWMEQSRYRDPIFFNMFNILGSGRPIHPIYDNDSLSPEEKDEIMLAYDWQQVGNDIGSIIPQ